MLTTVVAQAVGAPANNLVGLEYRPDQADCFVAKLISQRLRKRVVYGQYFTMYGLKIPVGNSASISTKNISHLFNFKFIFLLL